MSLHTILRTCKNLVVPKGAAYRRIPFGPAAGCTMNIDLTSHMHLYLGLYERELEVHFRALIQLGDNCFDVGGKGGYDALILARMTGGRVVSFECDAPAAEEMRETFRRNRFPIETVEAFVGRDDGEGKTTLDSASERYFTPDFLKLDIEGAEADALRGAGQLLGERKPSMIIEVHEEEIERECLALLTQAGYEPVIVDQRRGSREVRPLAHNRWLVCAGRRSTS